MTQPYAVHDVAAVEKAVQELQRRADVVHAQFVDTAQRSTELHARVSAAKGRAALGEEVQRLLEALQHRAHERSVGAFERLLTAILRDVLPGEGQVKFDLAMRNNTTALDILLEKNGFLESALEGNGGAVANVLSAGLRFAALSRTKNRRLLVLDEPDCWVKPERIPAFVNVIAKVSQASQFQTFFISHHETELFEGAVNVIKLGRDASGRVAVCAESFASEDWDSEETPGIRAMELINVRQHEHTVLRFRPGATALVGPNNLGKSTAIHSALKAVAYGESSDDLIRHGCDEATIVLHLERGRRIVWSRKLKRSPVVVYQLYQGEDLVSEGRPGKRNEAPTWVVDELGITPVDDLDVQLRNQKKPVFLLDDTASRRAQVLSIGRESGYLKQLFAEYDAVKVEDRETVRQGEAEYARLQWRLRGKPSADLLPESSEKTGRALAELRVKSARLSALKETLAQLEARTVRIQSARQIVSQLPASIQAPKSEIPVARGLAIRAMERGATAARILTAMPNAARRPEAVDPAARAAAIRAIERGAKFAALKLPEVPPVPNRAGPAEIARLGSLIRRGFTMRELAAKISKSVNAPRIGSPAELRSFLELLTRSQSTATGFRKELDAVGAESARLQAEEQLLREQLGDHCPLCGSHLPETGFKHVH